VKVGCQINKDKISKYLAKPLRVLSVIHIVNDGTVVLLPTLLPVATTLFGIGYEKLGILVALGYLANVLVQPVAGRYSEKIEPKYLLAVGIGTMALSMLIVAYAPDYSILLLGAVCLRIGSSFYHPISSSVVSKIGFHQGLDKQMGILSAFGDLGSMLIFLSAALLYSFLGWKAPFLIFMLVDVGTAAFVVIFLGYFHRANYLEVPTTAKDGRDEMTQAVIPVADNAPNKQRFRSRVPISFLFVGMFVSGGSYAIILNFANSLLTHYYGSVILADVLVGLFLAALVLGDFLTGTMSKKIGRIRFLMVAYAFSALLTGVFSVSLQNHFVGPMALVGTGFSLSFTFPLIYSEIASRPLLNGRGHGTVFGFLFSSQIIGSAVLSYVAGEISALVGPIYPFVLAAILMFVVTAAGLLII
jgi:MFS transporter, FSR family, fosmidomycin resistance protein